MKWARAEISGAAALATMTAAVESSDVVCAVVVREADRAADLIGSEVARGRAALLTEIDRVGGPHRALLTTRDAAWAAIVSGVAGSATWGAREPIVDARGDALGAIVVAGADGEAREAALAMLPHVAKSCAVVLAGEHGATRARASAHRAYNLLAVIESTAGHAAAILEGSSCDGPTAEVTAEERAEMQLALRHLRAAATDLRAHVRAVVDAGSRGR
ncbi:MAG: hypothetical protein KF819_06860 [Labilithrix sp.]|nr:hypothetical protein [Labilithrix sp.]